MVQAQPEQLTARSYHDIKSGVQNHYSCYSGVLHYKLGTASVFVTVNRHCYYVCHCKFDTATMFFTVKSTLVLFLRL
jgi:hypothetical protein